MISAESDGSLRIAQIKVINHLIILDLSLVTSYKLPNQSNALSNYIFCFTHQVKPSNFRKHIKNGSLIHECTCTCIMRLPMHVGGSTCTPLLKWYSLPPCPPSLSQFHSHSLFHFTLITNFWFSSCPSFPSYRPSQRKCCPMVSPFMVSDQMQWVWSLRGAVIRGGIRILGQWRGGEVGGPQWCTGGKTGVCVCVCVFVCVCVCLCVCVCMCRVHMWWYVWACKGMGACVTV